MHRTLVFLFCISSFAVSPADQRIAVARQQVDANPKAFQTYNELAFALCRKARDTSDVSLYAQATSAINRSLELSPGNYDAMNSVPPCSLASMSSPQP